MKRTVRKITPSQQSTFDQQRWPVLIAVAVFCGIAAGAVMTVATGIWLWASLLLLLGLSTLAIRYLYRLNDSRLSRSVQFSIVVSLAFHLLLLIFAAVTSIFQNPYKPPQRPVVETKVRPIEISDQQAAFVWEKVNSRETPEPDVDVEREDVAATKVRPMPLPVIEVQPDINPQLVRRETMRSSSPMKNPQLSKLNRQDRSDQLRSSEKLLVSVSEIELPDDSKKTADSKQPVDIDVERDVEVEQQNSQLASADLPSLEPKVEGNQAERSEVERRRLADEPGKLDLKQPDPQVARSSDASEQFVETIYGSFELEKDSSSQSVRSTSPKSYDANELADDVQRQVRIVKADPDDVPAEQINGLQPPALSPINREARTQRRRTEDRVALSITNPASSTRDARRSTQPQLVASSPIAIENPARAPESRDVADQLNSKTLSVARGSGGVAGIGRSKNLDRFAGGQPSPNLTASNSARRQRTQSLPDLPQQLASSQRSRTRRSAGPALTPESVLKADTAAVAKRTGAVQPKLKSIESSAAEVTRSSSRLRDELSAEKGTGAIDVGPTNVVKDRVARRQSGGGQIEVARLSPSLTRRSRDQSTRQPTLAATSDVEVAAPRMLSAAVSSIQDAQPAEFASIAKRSGGENAMTAQAPAAADLTQHMSLSPSNSQSSAGVAGNRQTQKSVSAEPVSLPQSKLASTSQRQRTETALNVSATAIAIADPNIAEFGSKSANVNPAARLVTDSKTITVSRTSPSPTAKDLVQGVALNVDASVGPAGLSLKPDDLIGVMARPASRDSQQLLPDLSSRFRRRDFGGVPSVNPDAAFAAEAFQSRSPQALARMADPSTEESIQLGLEFLASHQMVDGSWGLTGFDATARAAANQLDSDTAATGLAVLAFQGAGYNHREYKYAEQLDRAIEWLVENQSESGDLYVPSDKRSNSACHLYSHGIAALALTEAYGMTQDPRLKEPAQQAIRFIENTQDPQRGGWRYFIGSGRQSTDTSVSGWMMTALHSGRLAGLDVKRTTLQGIQDWLDVAADGGNQSRYRYNPFAVDTKGVSRLHGKKTTSAMTAVGLLMQVYSGWEPTDSRLVAGADYLIETQLPDDSTSQLRDSYYWYYATQVLHHAGGAKWDQWNKRLRPLLSRSQQKSGKFVGSWDPFNPVPDRWGRFGGRLYVTSLNLMSLEVRHRMLPLYRKPRLPSELRGIIEGGELELAKLAKETEAVPMPEDIASSEISEASDRSETLERTQTVNRDQTSQQPVQQKMAVADSLPALPTNNASMAEIAEQPQVSKLRGRSVEPVKVDPAVLAALVEKSLASTSASSSQTGRIMKDSEVSPKAVDTVQVNFPKLETPAAPPAAAVVLTDQNVGWEISQINVDRQQSRQAISVDLGGDDDLRSLTMDVVQPNFDIPLERREDASNALADLGSEQLNAISKQTLRKPIDSQLKIAIAPIEFPPAAVKAIKAMEPDKLVADEAPNLNPSSMDVAKLESPTGNFGEVSGSVSLDGETLGGARVTFIPMGQLVQASGKTIVAKTNEQGVFAVTATSTASKQGIPAGEYKVTITTVVESPDANTIDLLEVVPREYNVQTELVARIEPGETTKLDFDLETKVAQ